MNEIILETLTKIDDNKNLHQIIRFELAIVNDKEMPNKYVVSMYEKAYKNGLLHMDFVSKFYFDKIEEAIKKYRIDCKEIV